MCCRREVSLSGEPRSISCTSAITGAIHPLQRAQSEQSHLARRPDQTIPVNAFFVLHSDTKNVLRNPRASSHRPPRIANSAREPQTLPVRPLVQRDFAPWNISSDKACCSTLNETAEPADPPGRRFTRLPGLPIPRPDRSRFAVGGVHMEHFQYLRSGTLV